MQADFILFLSHTVSTQTHAPGLCVCIGEKLNNSCNHYTAASRSCTVRRVMQKGRALLRADGEQAADRDRLYETPAAQGILIQF